MCHGKQSWRKYHISLCFPRYGKKSDVKLIDIIHKTTISFDIAIFNFTDKHILKAILEAKDQNVAIRIITDKTMSFTPVQFFILRKFKKKGENSYYKEFSPMVHASENHHRG